MILIATFIAQQYSRPVILRYQQIGRTVAVIVSSDNGARLFKLNLVEADVGSDVLEAVRPKIAE